MSAIVDHYLVIAKSINSTYFNEFLEAASILQNLMTKKEYRFWLKEKMLLKQSPFLEKAFIQNAVETSVVRFFGEKYPSRFRVEAEVNPNSNKNVDCQFNDNGFIYNVEVKCSSFEAKEEISKLNAFKSGTIGRLDDRGEKAIQTFARALDEGLKNKGEPTLPHVSLKKMDNNLKDFLESAHGKFDPKSGESEVNVLIVGCDECTDIQDWLNYMWAPKELFTNESYADVNRYRNVDVVVLTNQYFKHNKYQTKRVVDCWSIEKCFNIISSNPHRKRPKEKAIKHFLEVLPNHSEEYAKYRIPGSMPLYIQEPMKVLSFVKQELEGRQNLFLFEREASG